MTTDKQVIYDVLLAYQTKLLEMHEKFNTNNIDSESIENYIKNIYDMQNETHRLEQENETRGISIRTKTQTIADEVNTLMATPDKIVEVLNEHIQSLEPYYKEIYDKYKAIPTSLTNYSNENAEFEKTIKEIDIIITEIKDILRNNTILN